MKLRTYDRIQLSLIEVGVSCQDAQKLPWVRARVAKLTENRLGMDLEIGAFVGSLTMPSGLLVEIEELVPGTVDACIQIATGATRIVRDGGVGKRTISAQETVAVAYASSLAKVLRLGVEKTYRTRSLATTRPRGKLLLQETLRDEWSRGRNHRVVTRWNELTEDTDENRFLLAAACRADALIMDASLRLGIRRSIAALGGARYEPNPKFPIAEMNYHDQRRQVLELANLLISGVPYLPVAGRPSPFDSWINVDRLFERAVFSLFERTCPPGSVSRGENENVFLFRTVPGEAPAKRKMANPDVVVRRGSQIGVVDAKYRRSGAMPSESEIYQLISHADAFGATSAALVSPAIGQPVGTVRLGRVRSGFTVDVIAVDPTNEQVMEKAIGDWVARL